jgi:hypothetical protein
MNPKRVRAGQYEVGPYLISMVRRGYWDIWEGEEQVEIDGWAAWPTLAEAWEALRTHIAEQDDPKAPNP